MNLMLLTFGEKLENHYQAFFSIASFLKDKNIEKIIVVTDRVDFYKIFENKVSFFEVDNELLNKWKGKHKFFWRIKIKAIQAIYNQFPEQDLLYVDSDTFLIKSLDELHTSLQNGKPFMHLKEELLSQGKSKTVREMWKCLQGKSFANIHIDKNTAMWNAGIIALPAKYADKMLELTLQVCDEICATSCPKRLVEQFSFSLAMNHISPLNSAENIIAHYWGNKNEWNHHIGEKIIYAFLNAQSLSQFLQNVSNFSIKHIPLLKKQSNTAIRLEKLINKIFKTKKITYIK
ncbi:hypothetical protein [Avibacterium avium]|uniref:hypothetical protein n=3 Tax=Avibacterium avium TaxID=751 RepID=UPI003BF7D7FF